jgi:hypothetical protein
MAKINYKKKFSVSWSNKKRVIKNGGGKNNNIGLELPEFPSNIFEMRNEDIVLAAKQINGVKKQAEDLIVEDPRPVFKPHKKNIAVDATADTIVDMPFTETYEGDFNENRRGAKILILNQGEKENQKNNI